MAEALKAASSLQPSVLEPTFPPALEIRRAAVLGAGAMGVRLAALLANAGIPVLLLDLPSDGAAATEVEPLAEKALRSLASLQPAALTAPERMRLIETGSFAHDLARIRHCDWVLEAVTERMDVKVALLQQVIPHLHDAALLTTNTSGLPVGKIAETTGTGPWRRRFFGTHFFNPPRYMRLVEVIATAQTDPELLRAFASFADLRLGKEVVRAADGPNFIANRIGAAAMLRATELLIAQKLTLEEVDALTGPVMGWPRMGTFRLADMVGLDVLLAVVRNAPEAGTDSALASLLAHMVARGWLGDKAGQGFYKKQRNAEGKEERMALDLNTLGLSTLDLSTLDLNPLEYRPMRRASLAALDLAKHAPSVTARLNAVLDGNRSSDRSAAFLWPFLLGLWRDAASLLGTAAETPEEIDTAMRAGFNWELGPFELWDAVGFRRTLPALQESGLALPPAVAALQAVGGKSWYQDGQYFHPARQTLQPCRQTLHAERVADYKRRNGTLRSNAGASLVESGDGITVIELHSLKNAIGADGMSLITSALRPDSTTVRHAEGFVLTGDRDNFAVGANLLQLLLMAQEGEWDELRAVIGGFQQMTAAIKFCPRPVVVAPFGLTLGGGAEMTLHAARRQAHVESYIGLVEAGVGLIPAGGGTKEMLLRAVDRAAAIAAPDPATAPAQFARCAELQAALQRAFETIALAKVSTSAEDARKLWFLDSQDAITMNRNRLLNDARRTALHLAAGGYAPPAARTLPAPGSSALAALELGVCLMREAGYASEHDAKVARQAAQVLCGGRVTPGTAVSEQQILDLELEAFLSLCGERKTQERIAYTLKTGKPLRN